MRCSPGPGSVLPFHNYDYFYCEMLRQSELAEVTEPLPSCPAARVEVLQTCAIYRLRWYNVNSELPPEVINVSK